MNSRSPRRQCKKCPWKRSADPRAIPNGYDEDKHRALDRTVAAPEDCSRVFDPLHLMACHESPVGADLPCVGWLVHQIGPGNNIALRMRVLLGKVDANVETVGPQHERFEDTLPT